MAKITANRFHDNLITGYGGLDNSRPLDYFDPINSPRVYGRPTNIRQIVSFWGRLKAAWLVFTFDAIAVRWYDEKNAHKHGRIWHEQAINRHPTNGLFAGSGPLPPNSAMAMAAQSPCQQSVN